MVVGQSGASLIPVMQLNVALEPRCFNATVQILHQKMEGNFVQDPALE